MNDSDKDFRNFMKRHEPQVPRAPIGERQQIWKKIETPSVTWNLSWQKFLSAIPVAAVATLVLFLSSESRHLVSFSHEETTLEDALELSFFGEDGLGENNVYLAAMENDFQD